VGTTLTCAVIEGNNDDMFCVAAAILWVYIVQCKRDKITLVLPYLVTAERGTDNNNPETYAVD